MRSAEPSLTKPPLMSQAGFSNTHTVTAVDEQGNSREVSVAGESPLTLYLDKQEIVTLMTLGTHPELLTLGYLRNQGFIDHISQVEAVQVDWEVNAVAVVTRESPEDAALNDMQKEQQKKDQKKRLKEKLSHRTVTSGCGQGTVFGGLMDKIDQIRLTPQPLPQSQLYGLLDNLKIHNDIYKKAGGVHGCALCQGTEVLSFVEDVGRHNAVDTLAGQMLLEQLEGSGKIFYTTGRLTSEMVIKVAQMGIPTLVSRSGVTQMGLDLARQVNLTLIGRCKGRHFLIFNGREQLHYDQQPAALPRSHKRGCGDDSTPASAPRATQTQPAGESV